ncbi:MAG: hypothetical protein OEZ43_15250 [Gammaproteobacteria bacterium]|nr:hypothetical protein [Gammaproteobacteria bacterium]
MPIRTMLFRLSLLSVTVLMLSACGSNTPTECTGNLVELSDDLRYLKAKTALPLGNGSEGHINIYVQRVQKNDANEWTATPVQAFDDGRTPCQVVNEIQTMWKDYYQDMIDAGIHTSVIAKYLSSISAYGEDPARAKAGVYAEASMGACGYAGAPGTIHCGIGVSEDFKIYFLSHENTHGFQWDHLNSGEEHVLLYRIFAAYANTLYHQSVNNASQFIDTQGRWHIDMMDYALQNESEWLADVFKDYLYNNSAHWAYMKQHHPALVSFFDCIWKQGDSFTQCHESSGVDTVSFANSLPVVDVPAVSGYNATESTAIWNVCFNSNNKSEHTTVFDQVIEYLTPGLYANSADSYKLGYGDCDHNGVIDWICSYKGSAPDGSAYLWNSNNTVGAYTFIVTGDYGNGYVDYRQDPFLTLPTINGSLAQPMYREWQSNYGSCNGARYFNQVPTWFTYFASGVSNLPTEYIDKQNW